MSQFPVEQAFVFESGEARDTRVVGLSQLDEVRDLLDQYALGSLYMAEAVARQSAECVSDD